MPTSYQNTEDKNQSPHTGLPVWNLGFRPFFLGAAYFGALSVALWIYIYLHGVSLYPESISPSLWHAHELLFGYVLAVIAGFLLTATKSWTNRQTLHRAPLAALFFLWLAARMSLLFSTIPLALSAVFDLAFNAWLFFAIAKPVIATRQKRQYAILGKLLFLLCCNGLFYFDALGLIKDMAYHAIYTTLYVVIGLILMMSRRLIPFFIEAGVGYKLALRNSTVVDLASLFVFLGFFISEVFFPANGYQYFFAGLLVPVLAIRAWWWFTPGILHKPMLISLYAAYLALICGFILFALVPLTALTPLLAMHMLTIGGGGLITISMMGRVSLGHSGRSIHEPPKLLGYVFVGVLLAAFTRVLGPLTSKLSYPEWVSLSASIWVISLLCFALVYTPIWLRQRVDRQYG